MSEVAEINPAVPAAPLAHAALARLAPASAGGEPAAEASWLASRAPAAGDADAGAGAVVARWRTAPPAAEARLATLCDALDLDDLETLAVAVALAVDTDPMAARAVAWLQGSARASHPSIGLLACLDDGAQAGGPDALVQILDGTAVASGLLIPDAGTGSLQDTTLRVPAPLVAALRGGHGAWPEARLDQAPPPVLAADTLAAVEREALALLGAGNGLVIRSGHPEESRAGARALARAAGLRMARVDLPPPPGLGPWLQVHGAVPVTCVELQPGEIRTLPHVPGHDGPWIVATGPEGSWLREDGWGGRGGLASWTLPLPAAGARAVLWQVAGACAVDARLLGERHRHSAARIEALARTARGYREAPAAGGDDAVATGDDGGRFGLREVARAARGASRGELGTLAEQILEDVADDALVLPPALRDDLGVLTARCHTRDTLAQGLGPAARARYRPGVRALFVGPSGTGKTLAASWLATRLGLPLYRVDIASVSSKYIGETEKNLGELFARAEHAEVVLLFDEADALFGKRTDVKDANDRFANQQTNYLLQRIESFDGIVVLTSNARGRFDAAFTRRLDAVLEFPLPLPPQRRALWQAHLGEDHALGASDLNRLASECELAGGHIRNVVLAARALAERGPIAWQHLVPAIHAEYRKVGKPAPSGIAATSRRD